VDTKSISIQAAIHHEDSFTIRNTGGGLLSGHILSRNRGLVFTPSQWSGNTQTITYSFSPDNAGLTPGITNTTAYICSNGGEIALPISINSAAMTIPTAEGPAIATISDFYDYALVYPAAARRMFTSSEFYMLLLSTGYKYMDVYENLHKDVNRERAMDNFFILSGLKSKTHLMLEKQQIHLVLQTDKIYERFQVQKSNSGYADAPIATLGGAPWLALSTGRLASSDYNNNLATVDFSIDPQLLSGMFAREHIVVGPTPDTNNILEITVRRAAPLSIRLNREGFRYEDRGSIEIENNTGANIKVEVYCRDRYIRFYANTHMASAVHSIPFEIRPSAFASAQRLFSRLPYISTYIDVRAHAPGQVFHKRLHLNIGEW